MGNQFESSQGARGLYAGVKTQRSALKCNDISIKYHRQKAGSIIIVNVPQLYIQYNQNSFSNPRI